MATRRNGNGDYKPPTSPDSLILPSQEELLELEPIELSLDKIPLSQLPYTGGNIALFAGTGLCLGSIGLYLRRRQ